MVKIITMITKFIIVTLTALLFASCNFSANMKSIRGNGHVTTEKRIVQGDFKSVEVSNAIDLVIEQSDKTEITVEADDNLQKEISTKVENGVLIISCDYNSFINIKSKKVTVKMPLIVITTTVTGVAFLFFSITVLFHSTPNKDYHSQCNENKYQMTGIRKIVFDSKTFYFTMTGVSITDDWKQRSEEKD